MPANEGCVEIFGTRSRSWPVHDIGVVGWRVWVRREGRGVSSCGRRGVRIEKVRDDEELRILGWC
jgi:hypothetical protein